MSICDCDVFADEEGYDQNILFMYSTIDDILSSEEFTVQDVLKSDDLIQEVNGFNGKLLDYLS